MEFLLIAFATAFSIHIIKVKAERCRYEDEVFDCLLLLTLTFVFEGSFGGMVVAAVTSMMISLYFFISPPKFLTSLVLNLRKHI